MSENQTEFKGWARVEVMGHQTHIGYVESQAFGGAVMFRIDQPPIQGGEETLERPEYVENVYAPAGSVVKRQDLAGASVLVGAASIYRIIPCDEAAALKAIRSSIRAPLMIVKLAEQKQIGVSFDPPEDERFDDGEEE